MPTSDTSVFKVDKFVVPESALAEFWTNTLRTHAVLAQQPGFVRDEVLEQFEGPGRCNVVTMVEWASLDAMRDARQAALASHRAAGFNPPEFFARTGVVADVGNFRRMYS